jgi:hypothetical protein
MIDKTYRKAKNKMDHKHQKIIIDEEFKALLPALDQQTYAMLEESLLKNGCMNPLVLWNGVLIDGHNRYEICKKHKIPFTTVDKEFGSRDEALIWIISTQVARRNLTPIQLSYFRGVHYNADKRMAGNKTGRNQHSEELAHSELIPQSTVKRLSDQYNVSEATIKRDAQAAAAIDAIGKNSPEAKKNILSGAAEIDRKYLRELGAEPEEIIKETAASIAEGTFKRQKKAPESDVSADDVLAAFNTAIVKMADEFEHAVQRLKNEVGVDKLRSSLRGHIEMLEEIYQSL